MFLCISCEGGSPAVDSQYLNSKLYQSFNSELEDENSFRIGISSLRSLLQWIAQCPKVHELKTPIELGDSLEIRATLNNNQCSKIEKLSLLNYNISLIGFNRYNNLLVRWVLIGNESAYQNQRLLVAVYDEEQLESFRRVGIFKDNLSYTIKTSISVKHLGENIVINAIVGRNSTYPIRRRDSSSLRYIITADGQIIEQQ